MRGSASAEAGDSWCNAEGRAATSESESGPEVTEQTTSRSRPSTRAGALACPSKPPRPLLAGSGSRTWPVSSSVRVPATDRTLKQRRPPSPAGILLGPPGPGEVGIGPAPPEFPCQGAASGEGAPRLLNRQGCWRNGEACVRADPPTPQNSSPAGGTQPQAPGGNLGAGPEAPSRPPQGSTCSPHKAPWGWACILSGRGCTQGFPHQQQPRPWEQALPASSFHQRPGAAVPLSALRSLRSPRPTREPQLSSQALVAGHTPS